MAGDDILAGFNQCVESYATDIDSNRWNDMGFNRCVDQWMKSIDSPSRFNDLLNGETVEPDPVEQNEERCTLTAAYDAFRAKYPKKIKKLPEWFKCEDAKRIRRYSEDELADELSKYIVSKYDDSVGEAGKPDPIEVIAFLENDFDAVALTYFGITQERVGSTSNYTLWLAPGEYFKTSFGKWRLEKFTGRDPLRQLSFSTFENAVRSLLGTPDGKKLVTETTAVSVGDSMASLDLNSAQTVRYARTNIASPSENIVLTSKRLGDTGEITFAFTSVNWTKENTPDLMEEPSVWVVPLSYGGALPPTDESIAASGMERQYFQAVYPEETGRDKRAIHKITVPTNSDYTLHVRSGVKHDPDDPTRPRKVDAYDNISVDVTTQHFEIAADVDKAVERTLVLGEQFQHVVDFQNGRWVPNGMVAQTANSEEDAVPRLLGRSYAKYHPRALDPDADFCKASRAYYVAPGSNYTFKADISGLDAEFSLGARRIAQGKGDNQIRPYAATSGLALGSSRQLWLEGSRTEVKRSEILRTKVEGGRVTHDDVAEMNKIVIGNGSERITIAFAQGVVYYLSKKGEIYREEHNYGYRKLIPIPGKKDEFWIAAEVTKAGQHEIVITEMTPDAKFSDNPKRIEKTRYWAEEDQQGRWYVSRWLWDESGQQWKFADRERASDKFDAMQVVLGYRSGSHKNIRFPFRAQSSKIDVDFSSFRSIFSSPGDLCDELRFDRVVVERR